MRAGYKRFKALNVLEKCASREFSVFTVFLFCFFFTSKIAEGSVLFLFCFFFFLFKGIISCCHKKEQSCPSHH